MNIPGLDMMSDEEFGKLLRDLSGEKEPVQKKEKKTDEEQDNYKVGYVTNRPIPCVQRKSGRMQKRTEKALMQVAIERGLHVGTKARIERRSIAKDGSWVLREVEEGTVIGICDHFFLVEIGSHRECFSWNEWAGDDYVKVRFRV
ncbi:MAG: hypothetical protein IKZ01_01280 [Anaerotignum sp.]|nr:hypothetical protein [Anaerotignum sp.]MBR5121932.1 hypothetical protein [Anaerotignum sp.]